MGHLASRNPFLKVTSPGFVHIFPLRANPSSRKIFPEKFRPFPEKLPITKKKYTYFTPSIQCKPKNNSSPGGRPTLPRHRPCLFFFVERYRRCFPSNWFGTHKLKPGNCQMRQVVVLGMLRLLPPSSFKTFMEMKKQILPLFAKSSWYGLALAVFLSLAGQASATTLFFEDFSDNSAGWTLGTEWQIGPATGSPGSGHGNPDPAQDFTPTSDNGLAGVIIGGNATTSLHDYYFLTSPVINLSNAFTPVTLSFRRWLNSDYLPFMQNVV